MAKRRTRKKPIEVTTITHDEASRRNIPTAEYRSVMEKGDQSPIQVAYQRRNRDLDPQLVWRGKDEQDWSDLVVQAPPLFIQEKVHPKVLIDDLVRRSKQGEQAADDQLDLFADFNGLPDDNARTEFYRHDANWSNRMILGDSLQVMASLAEREGLRGKVQCIYLDPPYGIKFNSNFQWSTTSRDVRDGKAEHITREPEQVKAFRDTWRDGIHSYLTYLRDRLTVARDLLTETGSIFVQIGDENVHRIRSLMDEVLGDTNFVSLILFRKTGGLTANFIPTIGDYVLWYCRDKKVAKFRRAFKKKEPGEPGATQYRFELTEQGILRESNDPIEASKLGTDLCTHDNLSSQGNPLYEFQYMGRVFKSGFKPSSKNISKLARAGRLYGMGNSLRYIRKLSDYDVFELNHLWEDVGISGFADPKLYVVQRHHPSFNAAY